jgi:hypothetical protein
MAGLSLKCYILDDGTDPIGAWFNALSSDAQGCFFGALEMLRSISIARLPENTLKELGDRAGSKCHGIFEVLVENRSAQPPYCHRVLGFIGPKSSEFTMVVSFDKNVDPDYEGPCGSAQERKRQVMTNARLARDCPY